MAWGQSPVIWPNPDDPEGRARFVLDDPSEAYLWRGLEECGRASVEAINWASEPVSWDMFKFAQVRSPSLLRSVFYLYLQIDSLRNIQSCRPSKPRPWRSRHSSTGSETPGRPARTRRLCFLACGLLFLTLALLFYFLTKLEKKVAEAASAADTLKKSLDAEVAERSTLLLWSPQRVRDWASW